MLVVPRTANFSFHMCYAQMSGWMSVTFVHCVGTAKDTAVVAMECE